MIPAVAHFIWFGKSLPFVYMASLRSAAVRGGFDRVILHHADPLAANPHWSYLASTPNFESRPLDPNALFEDYGALGHALAQRFATLTAPAARANMVRAAVLGREGGVYLDTDTITWRDMTSLRTSAAAFCGNEHITLPSSVKNGGNLSALGRAYWQNVVRDVYRRIPGGWRAFRDYEERMPRAVNNAVLGCEPRHPFIMDLLERMVRLSPTRAAKRFALGTHLLQQAVQDYSGTDLVIHDPAVFYPLGPEISQHWFRHGSSAYLGEMIRPETRVIHWYASVRTKQLVPQLNPEGIARRADQMALCRALLPFI